jgi:hypothetical protein
VPLVGCATRSGIWFLRDVQETVLVKVVLAMCYRVLAPGEVPPLRSLFVIKRGCVLHGMRVLLPGMWRTAHTAHALSTAFVHSSHRAHTGSAMPWYVLSTAFVRSSHRGVSTVCGAGMWWGEDVLLQSPHHDLNVSYHARAMTYADVHVLSNEPTAHTAPALSTLHSCAPSSHCSVCTVCGVQATTSCLRSPRPSRRP